MAERPCVPGASVRWTLAALERLGVTVSGACGGHESCPARVELWPAAPLDRLRELLADFNRREGEAGVLVLDGEDGSLRLVSRDRDGDPSGVTASQWHFALLGVWLLEELGVGLPEQRETPGMETVPPAPCRTGSGDERSTP